MDVLQLYDRLYARHGAASEPATWWPVYHGMTDPPEFERALSNVLVINSNWCNVKRDLDRMARGGLLTASSISGAPLESIEECIQETGLPLRKATTLKGLAALVMRFGNETDFCARVQREELIEVNGVGEQSADRTLLYACHRIAWPVDTYCLRVFAYHGLIPAVTDGVAARRAVDVAIKHAVLEAFGETLDRHQRFHALMQIEGVAIRQGAGSRRPRQTGANTKSSA